MKQNIFAVSLGLLIFSGIASLGSSEISAQSPADNTRFPYFTDVESSHPNFFAITSLMQKGIINGYSDGSFQADKPVSRAETLKILLLGSQIDAPEISGISNQSEIFIDIDNSQWYARYVQEAKKREIVKGRGDSGKFFPADTVNKAEALKMLLLVNGQALSDPSEKPYNDIEISDWFSGYFSQAQSRKLFNESQAQNVFPAKTLTRGDLVEMMYRYQRYEDQTKFSGILNPAGTEVPEKMTPIETDAWDGITLDKKIIPLFRKGEIHTISGKISGTSDTVSIIVTNSLGESSKFSGDSRDGKFSIPVFFKDTGPIQIGILKGLSGSYITYQAEVFSGTADSQNAESSSSPENFTARHILGQIFLEWDDTKNDIFHIQIRQNERVKNLYINGENSATIPHSALTGFQTGTLQVFIRGSVSDDSSSLSLSQKFSNITESSQLEISVFERFTETVDREIEITSATYEYDNTISVQGKFSGDIQIGKGYVLSTGEELFEKDLNISGKNFSLTFRPKTKDFYVVEISDIGGRALAVLPIAPRGIFPVIPNSFDVKAETLTKISELDALRRINTFRRKYNRNSLKSDTVISELALIRAEDMNTRNYFSHHTPAGKTVNDFRSDLGVTVPLSENIAIHSDSGLDATYSLEFSPTHRKNLLDENISRVGIGMEERPDGSIILVQLFAGEKVTETVIADLQSEISGIIQSKNSTLTESTVLQKMTQQWAHIMADKKTAKFSYDSGEDWDTLLKNYKIQRTSNVFIGSFPSQEQLSAFIADEPEKFAEIFSPQKKTFAASISVSDEGTLFLCMVGEE